MYSYFSGNSLKKNNDKPENVAQEGKTFLTILTQVVVSYQPFDWLPIPISDIVTFGDNSGHAKSTITFDL